MPHTYSSYYLLSAHYFLCSFTSISQSALCLWPLHVAVWSSLFIHSFLFSPLFLVFSFYLSPSFFPSPLFAGTLIIFSLAISNISSCVRNFSLVFLVGVPSLFHILPPFLLVLSCHRSFLEGYETMSVYCFQLHVLYMHLFIFHFPFPLLSLSQFLFYPAISEIPRCRPVIKKNNILMVSSSVWINAFIWVLKS